MNCLSDLNLIFTLCYNAFPEDCCSISSYILVSIDNHDAQHPVDVHE
jgi:hypothetical protein